MPKPKLFISYRRDDSQHVTDRIYEHMVRYFGQGNVFQDVDEMPFGVDFRQHLTDQIRQADAMLIIIGKEWTRIMQERADSPTDYVRYEIEEALEQDMLLIPVLIKNAQMPSASQLPQSIREIVYLNAARVRPNPDFRDDSKTLAQGIFKFLKEREIAAQQSIPPTNLPTSESRNSSFYVSGYVIVLIFGALMGAVILVNGALDVRNTTRDASHNASVIEETLSSEIRTLQISLQTLATDVHVFAASPNTPPTIKSELVSADNSRLESAYNEEGLHAIFELNEVSSEEFSLAGNSESKTLRLTVPRDVMITVDLDADSGDINMDMAQMDLERLNFELGSGDALVTLPIYQPQSPDVYADSGMWTVRDGDLQVQVPSNLGVQFILNREQNAEPMYPGNFKNAEFQLMLSPDFQDFILARRQYDAREAQATYEVDVLSGAFRVDLIN